MQAKSRNKTIGPQPGFSLIEILVVLVILGVILGPIAETNLRRALMTDGDPTLFLTRPVSLIFLIIYL